MGCRQYSADDLPIDLCGHCLRAVQPGTQRRAKGHVHTTLFTGNSPGYRGHIFLLAFFVTALRRHLMQLTGLHGITGIQLIGDGHRHNTEALDMLAERLLALVTAHGQHLYDHRFSAIHAIFGPPLALRNPDRCIFLQQ